MQTSSFPPFSDVLILIISISKDSSSFLTIHNEIFLISVISNWHQIQNFQLNVLSAPFAWRWVYGMILMITILKMKWCLWRTLSWTGNHYKQTKYHPNRIRVDVKWLLNGSIVHFVHCICFTLWLLYDVMILVMGCSLDLRAYGITFVWLTSFHFLHCNLTLFRC